jgi:hypothetical protein
MRVQQFVQFADKITVPFKLAELTAVSKDPATEKVLKRWCDTLEKPRYQSRPFSGQYFDEDGKPFFYYMGDRIKNDPPKEYTLKKDAFWENFYLQLQDRSDEDLRLARKAGKEIVCDGLSVSLPSFYLNLLLAYVVCY